MLKPAIKTLEGQSTIAIVVGCLGALGYVLHGGTINADSLVHLAETTKSLADASSTLSTGSLNQFADLGKISAILTLVYKVLNAFIEARTLLKKDELAAKASQQTQFINTEN